MIKGELTFLGTVTGQGTTKQFSGAKLFDSVSDFEKFLPTFLAITEESKPAVAKKDEDGNLIPVENIAHTQVTLTATGDDAFFLKVAIENKFTDTETLDTFFENFKGLA